MLLITEKILITQEGIFIIKMYKKYFLDSLFSHRWHGIKIGINLALSLCAAKADCLPVTDDLWVVLCAFTPMKFWLLYQFQSVTPQAQQEKDFHVLFLVTSAGIPMCMRVVGGKGGKNMNLCSPRRRRPYSNNRRPVSPLRQNSGHLWFARMTKMSMSSWPHFWNTGCRDDQFNFHSWNWAPPLLRWSVWIFCMPRRWVTTRNMSWLIHQIHSSIAKLQIFWHCSALVFEVT